MDKISVRQNETFQIPIEIDDDSAQTVTFKVLGDDSELLTDTKPFVDGKATIDTGIVVLDVGTYKYSVTIVYTDAVDILPDVTECRDCTFPEFEVCSGGV